MRRTWGRRFAHMIIRAAIFSNGRHFATRLVTTSTGLQSVEGSRRGIWRSEFPSFASTCLERQRLRMEAFLCLLDDHTACIISKARASFLVMSGITSTLRAFRTLFALFVESTQIGVFLLRIVRIAWEFSLLILSMKRTRLRPIWKLENTHPADVSQNSFEGEGLARTELETFLSTLLVLEFSSFLLVGISNKRKRARQ